MSGARSKPFVDRATLTLAALFVVVSQIRTFSEPDFWMRLAVGRAVAEQGVGGGPDPLSYTRSQSLWCPEWLFDLALYRGWQLAGAAGVWVLCAALLGLGTALALVSVRSRVTVLSAAAALTLAGWLWAPHEVAGSHSAAAFFVGLYLWVLRGNRRLPLVMAVLVPAQWVWAQCSLSFPLGPLLLAVAAAEFAWDRFMSGGSTPDERRRLMGLGVLWVLLVAVSFLHPMRSGVWRAAWLTWMTPPELGFNVWISPFAPLIGSTLSRRVLLIAFGLGAAGLMLSPQRLPWLPGFAAIAGGFLVLRSAPALPLFTVLALPFLAVAAADVASQLHRFLRLGESSAYPAALALTGVLLVSSLQFVTGRYYRRVGSLSRWGLGAEERPYPAAAAMLLEDPAFAQRPMHLPYDSGYLAWRYPHRRVFCDFRPAAHDRTFREAVARWARGDAEMQETLARQWEADAVLLNALWPSTPELLRRALETGAWALCWFDGVTAILVPNREPHRKWVAAPHAERGLQILDEDVNRFIGEVHAGRVVPPPPAALGAMAVFSALDRGAHAAELYDWVRRVLPDSPLLSLQGGIALAKAGKLEMAALTLERTTRRMRENPTAWFWLSEVYRQLGRTNDAVRAQQQWQRLTSNLAPGESVGQPRP